MDEVQAVVRVDVGPAEIGQVAEVKPLMHTEHYYLTPRADVTDLEGTDVEQERPAGSFPSQSKAGEFEELEKVAVDAKQRAETDVGASVEKLLADFSAAMSSSRQKQGQPPLSAATLKRIPTACRQFGSQSKQRGRESIEESTENSIDGSGTSKQLSWKESLRAFKPHAGTPSLTLPTSPKLHTARRSRERSTERDGATDRSEKHLGARQPSAHQAFVSTLPCTVPQEPHLLTPGRSRRPMGVSSSLTELEPPHSARRAWKPELHIPLASHLRTGLSNSVTEFDRPQSARLPWKPALTVPVAPHLRTELRSHIPRSRGSSVDSNRSRSCSQNNTPRTRASARRPQSARCTPREASADRRRTPRAASAQAPEQKLDKRADNLDTGSGRCRLDFGSDPVLSKSDRSSTKTPKDCAETARSMAHQAFDADCDGTKHLLIFSKDVPQNLSEAVGGGL